MMNTGEYYNFNLELHIAHNGHVMYVRCLSQRSGRVLFEVATPRLETCLSALEACIGEALRKEIETLIEGAK